MQPTISGTAESGDRLFFDNPVTSGDVVINLTAGTISGSPISGTAIQRIEDLQISLGGTANGSFSAANDPNNTSNTFTIRSSGTGDIFVDTGGGADTIFYLADSPTATALILGGNGTDSVFVSAGKVTILDTAGSGNDYYALGAGTQTLTFSQGNGTDTVQNFVKGEDVLRLALGGDSNNSSFSISHANADSTTITTSRTNGQSGTIIVDEFLTQGDIDAGGARFIA